ncbi:MAG: PFL family protein, partial [Clostridia bacterium]|nr:PFL family protein [Clostridia bacterium]
MLNPFEILETINMIDKENLDIRTITMGISLKNCADPDIDKVCEKVYKKITTYAGNLVKVGCDIEKQFGIPIINKRISVTPVATLVDVLEEKTIDNCVKLAKTLDKAAKEVGVNFIGGFSALVHKDFTDGEAALIRSIPRALAETDIVCSSVNVGSTKAGINMDAVAAMGRIIKQAADLTKESGGFACAKLVVFCNAVEDNPFMAGAFHGEGEGECVINVGVSGPGVVKCALEKVKGEPFGVVADTIKKTAFKITRMGQLVAQEASKRLGVPFGIVDLSLAPTPAVGDSVAYILEEMGLEKCGTHGTTAALALLNDAVKKGGVMASSYVGGLSGAFIPVSEDAGMISAAQCGALTLEKLEAMTCVCSVGLDMIVIPGDTTAATISGIIADEMAIGMINNKTTAVRLIPAPGKVVGDVVEFGGLLGTGPVMSVSPYSSEAFVARGGRIPA